MAAILADFSTFFTWLFTGGTGTGAAPAMVSSLVTWIVGTPLVMAVIAMFFAGFIVSIFFRIFHTA